MFQTTAIPCQLIASCVGTSPKTKFVFLLAATLTSAAIVPKFCTPVKTPARSAEPRSTGSWMSTINCFFNFQVCFCLSFLSFISIFKFHFNFSSLSSIFELLLFSIYHIFIQFLNFPFNFASIFISIWFLNFH
jgi:hypothetical protein